MARDKDLHPIHPGEVLREELLKTYKLTPQKLAKSIKVEERIIKELAQEQRDVTPELSYRLGLYWGIREDYWLDLQKHYELECWKKQKESQIKQKLEEKKKDPKLNKKQKELIDELIKQANKTENVYWEGFYSHWERQSWNKNYVNEIHQTIPK